jgi:Flp pilus assembly protein TadD
MAFNKRGHTKLLLEDFKGSLDDFNKAIQLDPKDRSAYYGRGFSKLNSSDIEGACIDWSKAGELGMNVAYNAIKEFCN